MLNTWNHRRPVSLSLVFFYAGTLIVSLTTFRPVAPFFNGSDTLYLVAVVMLVIRLLHEGGSLKRVFVRDNPFIKPLLVFIFGSTLSLINSSDLTAAATVMGKYIFIFGVWLPAGIYLLNTSRRIKGMLIMLVAAALVPLIPAICDYYLHTRMTVVIDRLLFMNLEHTTPQGGRFGSVMGHPNHFGLMVVVVFPVSLWMLFFSRTMYAKFGGLLFLCVLLIGGLVTASRATVLAVSIETLFFMTFMRGRSLKQRAAFFLILIVVTSGIIALAIQARPIIIVDRFVDMATYNLGEYEPDAGRIDFMIEAWQSIRTHPIAGLGVENTAAGLEGLGVHNTVLRLWAGIGVGGLVFICWVYLLAFRTAFKTLKMTARDKMSYYATMSFLLLVSFIGWFLIDMVEPQFYDRFKFITMILMFSLSAAVEAKAGTSIAPKKPLLSSANAK